MKTRLRMVLPLLLAVFGLSLAAAPAVAQNWVYDNGPPNGQADAWQINFGYAVADQTSVVNTSRSNIKGNITVWVAPGDTPTFVDWLLGTTPFSGNISSGSSALTVSDSFTNQYGYTVETASFSLGTLSLTQGNYWLTLENATTAEGNPVYWDENSGVGCTSPGCPSQAQALGIGTIPSEAFTLQGEDQGTTPEPSTLAMVGTGVLGLGALLRRRFSAGSTQA